MIMLSPCFCCEPQECLCNHCNYHWNICLCLAVHSFCTICFRAQDCTILSTTLRAYISLLLTSYLVKHQFLDPPRHVLHLWTPWGGLSNDGKSWRVWYPWIVQSSDNKKAGRSMYGTSHQSCGLRVLSSIIACKPKSKQGCANRESNPGQMLGRHLCYHYTIGAITIGCWRIWESNPRPRAC